ncbi:MAG TPA: pentapeptide repeat-containing protein [Trueperaceae bacterium]|nr:pentapeptide repeat-containing protein [Trueperaceae bacterium]
MPGIGPAQGMSRPPSTPAEPERPRYTDEAFDGLATSDLDFSGALLLGCTFTNCELSEASFRGAQLSECRFAGCELTMLDITDAVFQSVEFETCRLTGNDFSSLKLGPMGVMVKFADCDLSFCSFRKMDLTACAFERCQLLEAEFTRCELEGVTFAGCDLGRCTFNANNLIEADLRGARNYLISPLGNRIRGLKVELPEAQGLLVALEVELY